MLVTRGLGRSESPGLVTLGLGVAAVAVGVPPVPPTSIGGGGAGGGWATRAVDARAKILREVVARGEIVERSMSWCWVEVEADAAADVLAMPCLEATCDVGMEVEGSASIVALARGACQPEASVSMAMLAGRAHASTGDAEAVLLRLHDDEPDVMLIYIDIDEP